MKTTLISGFLIGVVFLFYKASALPTINTLSQTKASQAKYIFYLHGRIIEEQGVNAVSKDHGAYEYRKILDTFSRAGFTVISEARPKDTDPETYSHKVIGQIDSLLRKKVSPENITVIGASKGAGITIFISSTLKNEKVNFVIMGICGDDDPVYFPPDKIKLCGNILSIYEKSDPWGKSCQSLISDGTCVGKSKEIELNLGVGHGFLYRPYKEWVVPAIEWANENLKSKK